MTHTYADGDRPSPFSSPLAPALLLAAVALAAHLLTNHQYGFHQDELYFIACGNHPAFGYVDHPPLVPWIAKASTSLFGESLRALRFLPALAHAASVVMAGLLCLRMGGGRFAVGMTALCVLIAPVYLRAGNMLAIPAFEPFFWLAASLVLLRIIQEDRPRLWLLFGLICGVGLMNKHTMAFYGLGVVVGMACTPLRRHFLSPWLYAGGGVALLVFLPNLVWQFANGWPTLEFLRQLNAGTMSQIPAAEFLIGQILYLHPLNAIVWLWGLGFVLFSAAGRPYRVFGVLYLTIFLVLLIAKSKIYYLAPAYPMLMAAGAIALERFIARRQWSVLKPTTAGLLVLVGALFAPLSLPLMPLPQTDRFITGITGGLIQNAYELTGDLHAQYGWPELAEAVASVYHGLTPEERERAIIFGRSYAVAGAIDMYGGRYGLPHAYSGHMTYHMWGPPEEPVDVVIAVYIREDELEAMFESLELHTIPTHELANPWMQEARITVARKPRVSIEEVWPQLKDW